MTTMHRPLFCVVAGFALAAVLPAQFVAVEITPNPVQSGGVITATLRASVDGVGLLTNPSNGRDCVGTTQHQGAPNGPLVVCGFLSFCGPTYRLINQCESGSATHTACGNPGLHYLKVQYRNPAGQFATDWFPFHVAGDNTPVLSSPASPKVGQPLAMSLSGASYPGQTYIVLASLSTNAGFNTGNSFVSLFPDGLLVTSALNANAPWFTNSLGVLDGAGAAPAITFAVPPIPQLACLRMHFQAVVGLTQPTYAPSTVLNFSVRP